VGGFLAIAKETKRRRAMLELVAATWLVLIGGEIATRRENGLAQREWEGTLIRWVDDPLLRYDLLPSVPCEKTTTNDLGMVDVPRMIEKQADTMRVACLGDSVGADCSLPGQTTCAALESILRERRGGRPVEGLNFSVFGYNTMQEARSLELKAAAFRPDAVVVLYVVNDPYPDLAISHFIPGHLKFEHLLFEGARMAATRLFPGTFEPYPWMPSLYEEPRAWNGVVVAGFDRIAATAKNLGVPVVVAVFPLFLDPPWPGYAGIYAKVASEAQRHGFIALDLSRSAYANVPLSILLKPSRDVIHPNALAHQLAARAIADVLLPPVAEVPPP
jgi:lysophospholipase L1-like esterase